MLPWHPASGPVCAQAPHAKELRTADALDNAAGDDTDDGIWSATPWEGCSRTPLHLPFAAEEPENVVVGPVPGLLAIASVSGLQRQKQCRPDVTALYFSVVMGHTEKPAFYPPVIKTAPSLYLPSQQQDLQTTCVKKTGPLEPPLRLVGAAATHGTGFPPPHPITTK